MAKETLGDFSVAQSGDVFIAYQSTSGAQPSVANATFLAAIYTEDNYAHNTGCDGLQGWFNSTGSCTSSPSYPANGPNASGIPNGLTDGVNAMHLYPGSLLESGSENDNGRYTGTLNGDAATIRAAINDRTKWEMEDDLGTPFVTTATFFNSNTTVNITPTAVCTAPDVPTVTYAPGTICDGNASLLSISGDKNDATAWHVYTGSCGGTLVATVSGSTTIVVPAPPGTTYYVRGEGGCVTPGSCGTLTITTTAREDASFSYATATYCAEDIRSNTNHYWSWRRDFFFVWRNFPKQ